MPLVKKQSGWFWGSKGPFNTKAKALAVARAAYASGYKGENNLLITFDLAYTSEKRVENSQKK
jgi:hypothetical protein